MEKRTMRDYVYLTPSVLRQQLAGQWEEPLAAAFAARPVRILRLVASGSSYNAALCVRPYLRKWLDCEVLVTEPFTFCAYESCLPADELAVVISQSGYSTNALHALDTIRAKGRTAIGITSDLSSDFRTHADLLIDYGCGQESVGYVTMGVTALCLFLCLFALRQSGRSWHNGQTPTSRPSRQGRRCCAAVTGSCPPCRPSASREPAPPGAWHGRRR